jgi:hypothetical protein
VVGETGDEGHPEAVADPPGGAAWVGTPGIARGLDAEDARARFAEGERDVGL